VACPTCGFDPTGLGPGDAVTALRSFARRFGALIEPDEDHPEADLQAARVATLPAAEGAARTIAALGEDLRRVLVSDHPTLDGTGDPGPSVAGAGDDALGHLRAATDVVVELAASAHGQAWERTGWRHGQDVTALELLTDAVHAGAHHLRAAARALGR
jgi:hypothetical protein